MPEEYKHKIPENNFISSKSLMLYLFPIPLVIKLLISLLSINIGKVILVSLILFLLYSAAYLNRLTMRRIIKNQLRARPDKIYDYRLYAMILTGAGVLIMSFLLVKYPISKSIFLSFISMLGYFLVYGVTGSKEAELDLDNMPKATRKAVTLAYKDLDEIELLSKKLDKTKDKDIINNLENVLNQSYKILSILSETPEDASKARRFLSVYINRIKEILGQYIKLSSHNRETDFREKLANVLTEANKAFSDKETKLLDDDIVKLDIQLEVLDEQIKKEG